MFGYALKNNREAEMPYFYWLSLTLDIGIRRYMKMQSLFASPKELYEAGPLKWEKSGAFSEKMISKLAKLKKETNPVEEYAKMLEGGTRMLVFEDDDFPGRLKTIPSAPVFLFARGKLPRENTPVVSVIGARECSLYGERVAARLGEMLARFNISLASGMARGIDSISQRACAEAGGYSLAVLGGGPDICYPEEAYDLYLRLEKEGGIISEYPPGTEPKPAFFACRNRIISGISDAVCVVEARDKSGTMITVDAALEQGREVFAVPGKITDLTSRGCNELIKQGAGSITNIEEFLEELRENFFLRSVGKTGAGTDDDSFGQNPEGKIDEEWLEILEKTGDDSFTVGELAAKLNSPVAHVMTVCLKMSATGLMSNMGAGRFSATKEGVNIRFRKKTLKGE